MSKADIFNMYRYLKDKRPSDYNSKVPAHFKNALGNSTNEARTPIYNPKRTRKPVYLNINSSNGGIKFPNFPELGTSVKLTTNDIIPAESIFDDKEVTFTQIPDIVPLGQTLKKIVHIGKELYLICVSPDPINTYIYKCDADITHLNLIGTHPGDICNNGSATTKPPLIYFNKDVVFNTHDATFKKQVYWFQGQTYLTILKEWRNITPAFEAWRTPVFGLHVVDVSRFSNNALIFTKKTYPNTLKPQISGQMALSIHGPLFFTNNKIVKLNFPLKQFPKFDRPKLIIHQRPITNQNSPTTLKYYTRHVVALTNIPPTNYLINSIAILQNGKLYFDPDCQIYTFHPIDNRTTPPSLEFTMDELYPNPYY